MEKTITSRIKLGVFIVIGAMLLTFLVFKLGTQQRLFENRSKVIAIFNNVSGLRKGSDVRFSGVNIGAVQKIEIISDSAIKVVMIIEEYAAAFIKKDGYAQINTEGLIGSNYIAISPGSTSEEPIEDGETLPTKGSVELNNVLTRLDKTSINTQELTKKLDQIAGEIQKGKGPIGALIYDKGIEKNIHTISNSFAETGQNVNHVAKKMQVIPQKVIALTDKINTVGDSLTVTAGNTLKASENIQDFTEKLNNQKSTLGRLLTDTTMANKIDNTISTIDETAADVTKTSKRVRSNWFIRVFSKKDKKEDE